MSHQFSEQGLYHYVYNMADLSQLRGCVVVQPKPREHVIKITDGQFTPGKLGTIQSCSLDYLHEAVKIGYLLQINIDVLTSY